MGYGNFRGGGSRGGFSGGSRGGFRSGGFRSNFKREMTKIKCSQCGKEDEVPFKPREGTPVYCKECYFKQKGIEPRNNSFEGKKAESAEESDQDELGDDFEAEESEEA